MPTAQMPPKAATKIIEFDQFKGVDFSSELGAVKSYRSPDCVNMISEQSGRPVKRYGYETVTTFPARINGVFRLVKPDGVKRIVHSGDKLYLWKEDGTRQQLYAGMNNARSSAYQMDGKLWILDGKLLLRYDGSAVVSAQSVAYIPTTRINCPPQGGGEAFEAVNLLSDARLNEFSGDGTNQIYQLDATGIASIVKVEQRTGADWSSVGYKSYDGTLGKVTLNSVPPKPTDGAANVRITYKKPVAGSSDKINKCTTAILWGLGGFNRMFVAGNPEKINVDYCSDITTDARNAPTYFPDNGYGVVGQDNTKIVGYLRNGNDLAILKEDNDQDATVFLRSAEMGSDGKTVIFRVKTGIAGVGAISAWCTKDLRDDHMFLSRQGVFALTTNSTTSERYAQARSELINKKLIRESGLESAVATEFDGYLYIAVNGHVYVADASQKEYVGKSSEQYQYEWYYWEDVPVRCWLTEEGRLWFGTEDGRLCRFHNTKRSDSFNDDGRPILARWTTPEIAFDSYTKYKTIRAVYVKLNPYTRSSVKVYMKQDGAFVLKGEKNVDVFSFDDMDFSRFTFNTNTDVNVIALRLKAKRIVTTQLKMENDAMNEAFGLYGATVYYDLKSKVK